LALGGGVLRTDTTSGSEFTSLFSQGVYDLIIQSANELTIAGTNAAEKIIFENTAAPDTFAAFRFRQVGANGGLFDLTAGSRDPESTITANGGSIYVRDDGDDSTLYIKKGDASNTGWHDVLSKQLVVASMSRGPIFSFVDLAISTTALAVNLWNTNLETTAGKLAPQELNKKFDIEEVIDSTNGDLYEIDMVLNMSVDSGTVCLFQVVTENGVSATTNNELSAFQSGQGPDRHCVTLSGTFRGPTSITGFGGIFVNVRTLSGTATLRQYSGSITVKRIS